MIGFLRGKKTYFVAAGWIAWGIWTYAVERDPVAGTQRILEGVSLITLRAGVAKRGAGLEGHASS
ncbi:MAG TPA: hypothetical protein PK384_13985 [Candidatus Latescibacteria bacterium]|nr:hypothetical protein [Candidatus Latescibacterota bacterium]